jgi:drug/metabolite transporter (DMT)-like permease
VILLPFMVLAMFLWGGSWVSSKIIAVEDPLVLTFWRFGLTALSLGPLMPLMKSRLPRIGAFYGWAALAAVAMTAYNWLFFGGLRFGPAGQVGVLVTTMNPIWTFLFAQLAFGSTKSKQTVVGLVLGCFGGLFQILMAAILGSSMSIVQLLLFLLASALYALLTVTGQKAQKLTDVTSFSLILHVLATILALVPLTGHLSRLVELHWGVGLLLHLLYNALFSGTVATTLFFYGSRRLRAGTGSVIYLSGTGFCRAIVVSYSS